MTAKCEIKVSWRPPGYGCRSANMTKITYLGCSAQMTEIEGVPTDLLGDVTTLSMLESRALKGEADVVPALAVAHLREIIRSLATELRDDDIIRWFNSGDETWQRMCGVSGFAIICNGVVHRALMLAMN